MLIPAVLTTMGGARDNDGVMNVDADVGDIFESDYDGAPVLSALSCENSCV